MRDASMVVGRFHTDAQFAEYAAKCIAKWKSIKPHPPNTLIVLSAGAGIFESKVASMLIPIPENIIYIDPGFTDDRLRRNVTYAEAQKKLEKIPNPVGMVIGVNVVLRPVYDKDNNNVVVSLDEMLECLSVARDWPVVIVRSPNITINSTFTLKELFELESRAETTRKEKEKERNVCMHEKNAFVGAAAPSKEELQKKKQRAKDHGRRKRPLKLLSTFHVTRNNTADTLFKV